MNKEDFLRELAAELADLPEKDRDDAIKYYSDYIDDAGYDADTVIEELGTPASVAKTVRNENTSVPEPAPVDNPPSNYVNPVPVAAAPQQVKRRLPAWAIVMLTILSPVILVLGIIAFVLALIIICLLLAIAIILPCAALTGFASGFVMLAAGVSVMIGFLPTGLSSLGASFAFLGLGALVLILTLLYYGKFLPGLFRCLFRRKKKPVSGKEEVMA